MQSERSSVSHQNDLLSNTPNPSTSHQHGLSHEHAESSAALLGREDAGRALSLAPESDAASASSEGSRRGRNTNSGRLSSKGSKSSSSSSSSSSQRASPTNRVEEYERQRIYSRRTSDRISFQIVPSTREAGTGTSIEEFPNEVLTHILSYLPPPTLTAMSLVSKRLHNLVTTPHAWKIAFTRYFPGADALNTVAGIRKRYADGEEFKLSDKRSFTRLSALASWRSEYILRTRLLRSLGRGKPAQLQRSGRSSGNRHAAGAQSAAVVTYNSGLLFPVSHLHATFGTGLNKRQPLFMHGAVEQGVVTSSDPTAAKVNSWGLVDHDTFKHFADLFVGESEWGLGRGEMVGMPNVMDLSPSYGKVYGEACPGGRLFFTSVAEQRGRFLSITSIAAHEMGIPQVTMIGCSVCAVWIAKSDSVLKTTSGLFGVLAGFSNGVLAAYALGVNPVHDRRFEKGEVTARWVLCPGVPIISIAVDEKFSYRRHSQNRIWAVVLNALGEAFYLTHVPMRPDFKGKPDLDQIDRLAWATGRTVEWNLLEHTRRRAKPDPSNVAEADGSYTPRTSCYALGLGRDQVMAETKEIEKFIAYKPKHFQNVCEGWDMRRRLVVDFAGDDRHTAGESVIILNLGFEGKPASVRRYTRRKTPISSSFDIEPYPAIPDALLKLPTSGISKAAVQLGANGSPGSIPRSRTSSPGVDDITPCKVDWHISMFELGGLKGVQISAIASDNSEFALITTAEDPLLGMSGGSSTSSPLGSPLAQMPTSSSSPEIPGHRGRFLAIGTTTGIVCLWNMRGNISPDPDTIGTITPVRIIYTDSPQISCLALTSLYLVHGGNDGLVQAWDPLASAIQPIRTLNSRFSSRARRRLVQAQASAQGVGNNYYAAGAVVLDPDPTVLRGMVSLGTHLRYWSYSSTSADAYKSNKRPPLSRRSECGSNGTANEQKFSHSGRSVLKDYISNEKQELEREKVAKRKEDDRLSGRFGVGLLGAGVSEDEMLAYATMLSEESWTSDEIKRRGSEESSSAATSHGGDTVHGENEMDSAVAAMIRLSLLEDRPSAPIAGDIPIRYAKKHHSTSPKPLTDSGSSSKSAATLAEESDIEFALQLSLAEENSKIMGEDDFPALGLSPSPPSTSDNGPQNRKGKGKSRAT